MQCRRQFCGSPPHAHLLRLLAPLGVGVHIAAELCGVQHLAQLQLRSGAGRAGRGGGGGRAEAAGGRCSAAARWAAAEGARCVAAATTACSASNQQQCRCMWCMNIHKKLTVSEISSSRRTTATVGGARTTSPTSCSHLRALRSANWRCSREVGDGPSSTGQRWGGGRNPPGHGVARQHVPFPGAGQALQASKSGGIAAAPDPAQGQAAAHLGGAGAWAGSKQC